jgi:hypothetical protein
VSLGVSALEGSAHMGLQSAQERVYRLRAYEEALGILQELEEEEGYIRAKIGPVIIALPSEMGERLKPLVGQRIGVLRTEQDYRLRVF